MHVVCLFLTLVVAWHCCEDTHLGIRVRPRRSSLWFGAGQVKPDKRDQVLLTPLSTLDVLMNSFTRSKNVSVGAARIVELWASGSIKKKPIFRHRLRLAYIYMGKILRIMTRLGHGACSVRHSANRT